MCNHDVKKHLDGNGREVPTSELCFTVGHNMIHGKQESILELL